MSCRSETYVTKFKALLVKVISLNFPAPSHKNRTQNRIHFCVKLIPLTSSIPFTQKPIPKSDTFCLLFIVSIFLQEFLTQIIDFKLSSVCSGSIPASAQVQLNIFTMIIKQRTTVKSDPNSLHIHACFFYPPRLPQTKIPS